MLEGRSVADWVSGDSKEKRRWEDEVAAELDLAPGEVILDFPVKRAMFQLDVLVDRTGAPDSASRLVRLGQEGIPGLIDLPRLATELYRTARVLRLFTFERRQVDPEWLLERLASWPGGAGTEGMEPTMKGNRKDGEQHPTYARI